MIRDASFPSFFRNVLKRIHCILVVAVYNMLRRSSAFYPGIQYLLQQQGQRVLRRERRAGLFRRASTVGASESTRDPIICAYFGVLLGAPLRPIVAAVVSIPDLTKGERSSLPMCEHRGRIVADSVHSAVKIGRNKRHNCLDLS